MKIKVLLAITVLVALILVSCGKSAVTNAKLSTKEDTLSYAFGINIYNSLKQDSIILNPVVAARAMMEAADNKAFMDDIISRGYIYTYMNAREQAKVAKQAEENKVKFANLIAQGDSFLQKNKENPGVIVTASGLQYKVIKMGTGPKPTEADVVKVDYTGTLINGTKFDSSVDKGTPAQFQVNQVIGGWIEGLQLMPVGSKFMLYIPNNLAYGAEGRGEVIPPFSTLIFELELHAIVKQ
jgi:FKBP-type peptidyl-prolyl cis-trans isomerase